MSCQALLKRAKDCLRDAETLMWSESYNGACNRFYYASFYAARAALHSIGKDDSKTHRGLLNSFNLNLVKKGLLPASLGRSIKVAEGFRYQADYGTSDIEAADAEKLRVRTREIVAQIEAFLVAYGRVPPSGDDDSDKSSDFSSK